ncbi:hypothetical protein CYMTET_26040, partial [Cymbomonas tetramitiformis]
DLHVADSGASVPVLRVADSGAFVPDLHVADSGASVPDEGSCACQTLGPPCLTRGRLGAAHPANSVNKRLVRAYYLLLGARPATAEVRQAFATQALLLVPRGQEALMVKPAAWVTAERAVWEGTSILRSSKQLRILEVEYGGGEDSAQLRHFFHSVAGVQLRAPAELFLDRWCRLVAKVEGGIGGEHEGLEEDLDAIYQRLSVALQEGEMQASRLEQRGLKIWCSFEGECSFLPAAECFLDDAPELMSELGGKCALVGDAVPLPVVLLPGRGWEEFEKLFTQCLGVRRLSQAIHSTIETTPYLPGTACRPLLTVQVKTAIARCLYAAGREDYATARQSGALLRLLAMREERAAAIVVRHSLQYVRGGQQRQFTVEARSRHFGVDAAAGIVHRLCRLPTRRAQMAVTVELAGELVRALLPGGAAAVRQSVESSAASLLRTQLDEPDLGDFLAVHEPRWTPKLPPDELQYVQDNVVQNEWPAEREAPVQRTHGARPARRAAAAAAAPAGDGGASPRARAAQGAAETGMAGGEASVLALPWHEVVRGLGGEEAARVRPEDLGPEEVARLVAEHRAAQVQAAGLREEAEELRRRLEATQGASRRRSSGAAWWPADAPEGGGAEESLGTASPNPRAPSGNSPSQSGGASEGPRRGTGLAIVPAVPVATGPGAGGSRDAGEPADMEAADRQGPRRSKRNVRARTENPAAGAGADAPAAATVRNGGEGMPAVAAATAVDAAQRNQIGVIEALRIELRNSQEELLEERERASRERAALEEAQRERARAAASTQQAEREQQTAVTAMEAAVRTRHRQECLITGCDLEPVLEVARISATVPLDANNGLLLRADLARLFTARRLALHRFSKEYMMVKISEDLRRTSYSTHHNHLIEAKEVLGEETLELLKIHHTEAFPPGLQAMPAKGAKQSETCIKRRYEHISDSVAAAVAQTKMLKRESGSAADNSIDLTDD